MIKIHTPTPSKQTAATKKVTLRSYHGAMLGAQQDIGFTAREIRKWSYLLSIGRLFCMGKPFPPFFGTNVSTLLLLRRAFREGEHQRCHYLPPPGTGVRDRSSPARARLPRAAPPQTTTAIYRLQAGTQPLRSSRTPHRDGPPT